MYAWGRGRRKKRELPSQEEIKEARIFVTEKRMCLPPGDTDVLSFLFKYVEAHRKLPEYRDTHAWAHTCMYIHTHACTHTHMHVHTRTCMYTHTQTEKTKTNAPKTSKAPNIACSC